MLLINEFLLVKIDWLAPKVSNNNVSANLPDVLILDMMGVYDFRNVIQMNKYITVAVGLLMIVLL